MKKEPAKKSKIPQKLRIIACYAIVPVFFTIIYFMMYMTYEDIFQKNQALYKGLPEIWAYVYNFIPRLGEFYQRTAVHYMTIRPSFGLDLLFRLLDVGFSSTLVYALTYFILGEKPRLKTKDSLLFLALFVTLLLTKTSENFTYRFSYVNNYITALLVSVVFLIPYRLKIKEAKIIHYIAFLIIGFLFGISTEIMPVAFILILLGYLAYQKFFKKAKLLNIIKENKIKIAEIIGMFAGLIFFYLGAGLSYRTNGGYAEVYDYLKISGLFHEPIIFVYKFIKHFWYNIRYLGTMIPLCGIIIFDLKRRAKNDKTGKVKNNLYWIIIYTIFDILFMLACSLIAVHDDLYPRLCMPVLLANMAIIYSYIDTIISLKEVSNKALKKVSFALLIIASLMIIDVGIGYVYYHRQIDSNIEKIYMDGDEYPEIEYVDVKTNMINTPIFRIRQLSPFNWDV